MEGDALPSGFGGGMAEAEVTDGTHCWRQYVPQVAFHELFAWDGVGTDAAVVGAVFPTKVTLCFQRAGYVRRR